MIPTWFCVTIATVEAACLICDIWWFDAAQRVRKEYFCV
jgi:hypothetical protein